MEVVHDEVALFASNFIRMSLIYSFNFYCNGQSVWFFTYQKINELNQTV